MRKIQRRSLLCLLLTVLLGIGLLWYCGSYVRNGSDWASYPYNRHLYDNAGQLKGGVVLDRDGDVLSEPSETGRAYYPNADVRRATLHAVGDAAGNIGAGAQTVFADKLTGYNLLTGVYTPFGSGNKVYLTIDAYLNNIAYQAMQGRNGTVGVYNYKTGDILCMVSMPTFDPADPPAIDPDDARWEGVYVNRLLLANSTPGSIFKLVTLNAALEYLPDVRTRTWECTGSVYIGGNAVTCPRAHGTLDLEHALAQSCNGVFGQLAVEIGGARMQQCTDRAGLTRALRIDGIRTATGHFSFDGDDTALAWAGVGQGEDALCPISMLQYVGAIAGGGKAAVPRLLYKATTAGGFPSKLMHMTMQSDMLLEASIAREMTEMMRRNVQEVYGQERFGTLEVCAKSGTAEIGADRIPNAWFTGFIRDSATPYAFIVLVEQGGGGASVAGEVAARVLRAAVEKGY